MATAFAVGTGGHLRADAVAQSLPFTQNWANNGLITANDDWTGVAGIQGFLGDDASTTATGTDPQTIVVPFATQDVIANQIVSTGATGGVGEFHTTSQLAPSNADSVVGLQGSGTADYPHIVLTVSTTGLGNITASYNLRDIDCTSDSALQPVALQFRVGTSGNFTNVPAGFVADAATGPSLCTLVTPVSVVLPAAANNQAVVQLRIITSNAAGSDEWIGIDDLSVTGSCGGGVPCGVGLATPSSVPQGGTSLLSVEVTPGSGPPSTGLAVQADLSSIGGSATQQFLDDGLNGDAVAGDNIFSFTATVTPTTTVGAKSLLATISDAELRSSTTNIALQVTSNAPSATGQAVPSLVTPGGATLLTVTVTPGVFPTSTNIMVTGDLSSIGGSATQQFLDDGVFPDSTAGDNVFTFQAVVGVATPLGAKSLPISVSDGEGRLASTSISLTVVNPPTAIHDIQGSGITSPLLAQSVTVDGVVTAVRSNGFFIQTPVGQEDADPLTSQGLFVFTSSTPPAVAAVGNGVRVTGTVAEFKPSSDTYGRTLTELGGTIAVSLLQGGITLPAHAAISVNAASALDSLEPFEGMRVNVGPLSVVAPTDGFVTESTAVATSDGTFYGVSNAAERPFREAGIEAPDPLPSPPCCIPQFDSNPQRIRVDSDAQVGATTVNVATGATVSPVMGVLDYGNRTYTILPDPATPPVPTGGMSATAVRAPLADEVTVASWNLERFFDTVNDPGGDPVLTPAAFASRLKKASLAIRNILRTPDVLGVIEVENLSVLTSLANQINADAFIATGFDPLYVAYLEEGNDIGGIDVGFLVKSSRVTVVDVTQEGLNTMWTPPAGPPDELLNDRPPLVLRATVPGFAFTVIVNHMRSLNGIDDASAGARVRAKRRTQAEFLANLIQARQVADASERIISVGDYNAFTVNDGYVDSMGTIEGSPTPAANVLLASSDLVNPNLFNLVRSMVPASEQYSYSFRGNAQVLDHALGNYPAAVQVSDFEMVRLGSDFPETYRNDDTRPERLSDHDATITYFDTDTVLARDLGVTNTDGQTSATPGGTTTYTIVVTNSGLQAVTGATFTDSDPGNETTSLTWSCVPSSIASTCGAGAVVAGSSFSDTISVAVGDTITYTVTAAIAASATGSYVNTATVSLAAGELDVNPSNDTATDTDTLVASADLSLVKTANPQHIDPEGTVVYTLTVTNLGPSNSSAATLQDSPPSGVTFTGASAGCTLAGSVQCTVDPLAPGAQQVFTITGTVTAGASGTIQNTATLTASGDPVSSNNTAVARTPMDIEGELIHGFDRRTALGSAPDRDFYLTAQKPYSSYEVVIEDAGGDVSNGSGPVVQRLGVELVGISTSLVLRQTASSIGTGTARSLRWERGASALPPPREFVTVSSAQCTTCGADDTYRIRAYETTASIPRFNNSGSQITVLVLQNPTDAPITGTIYFWEFVHDGNATSHAFSLAGKQALVLNTSTLPGLSGISGHVTVAHDGRYGDLAGKAVALEPSTGFSFDTKLTFRER